MTGDKVSSQAGLASIQPAYDAEAHLDALRMITPYLEQQAEFDNALTNSVIDHAWAEAEAWASRFQALMLDVQEANDSIRVDRILAAHWRPDMDRTIAHYQRMQGGVGEPC